MGSRVLRTGGGKASVVAAEPPVLGKGQAIEFAWPNESRDRSALDPKLEFALLSSTLRNHGADPLIVDKLTTARPAGDDPAPTPNFLFLIADDLAARLGCSGDKAAITPNLDRLASEGVLFHRAYPQGSVCIPSRTSFMLGLNHRHAGASHFKRHPETMTLGRWRKPFLLAVGFHTPHDPWETTRPSISTSS